MFTVRYLNNMQLTGRGLIADFCLEDARKMHHRKEKLERQQKVALTVKKEARKERRADKQESKP